MFVPDSRIWLHTKWWMFALGDRPDTLTNLLFFPYQGTVIIIANHGDRIDIPPGAILENKIVSGNLRILDHWHLFPPIHVSIHCLQCGFLISSGSITRFVQLLPVVGCCYVDTQRKALRVEMLVLTYIIDSYQSSNYVFNVVIKACTVPDMHIFIAPLAMAYGMSLAIACGMKSHISA